MDSGTFVIYLLCGMGVCFAIALVVAFIWSELHHKRMQKQYRENGVAVSALLKDFKLVPGRARNDTRDTFEIVFEFYDMEAGQAVEVAKPCGEKAKGLVGTHVDIIYLKCQDNRRGAFYRLQVMQDIKELKLMSSRQVILVLALILLGLAALFAIPFLLD
ncbi:MAG: hypothetical protein LUG13_02320 [Oscillospiraceae bacterium]|nr:hypothetical protein [Oscillospiraceae bacterium]